jgi:hypothetical protein
VYDNISRATTFFSSRRKIDLSENSFSIQAVILLREDAYISNRLQKKNPVLCVKFNSEIILF